MERINVILPPATLARLSRKLQPYKRSQFLDLAARALLERIEGRRIAAEEYERMALELVKS